MIPVKNAGLSHIKEDKSLESIRVLGFFCMASLIKPPAMQGDNRCFSLQ